MSEPYPITRFVLSVALVVVTSVFLYQTAQSIGWVEVSADNGYLPAVQSARVLFQDADEVAESSDEAMPGERAGVGVEEW